MQTPPDGATDEKPNKFTLSDGRITGRQTNARRAPVADLAW